MPPALSRGALHACRVLIAVASLAFTGESDRNPSFSSGPRGGDKLATAGCSLACVCLAFSPHPAVCLILHAGLGSAAAQRTLPSGVYSIRLEQGRANCEFRGRGVTYVRAWPSGDGPPRANKGTRACPAWMPSLAMRACIHTLGVQATCQQNPVAALMRWMPGL